ncbi:NLP/P60 protein OS=Tsukamurella paurometabola (strain ATCC 8368 / DSM / CCUG 35730 / CIP 100753/ JCM 10117 / KCTC 9821 / NBRC 16120 / NCIMB 702349 / NCTC 13040) OX=521096 GN=Tpau_2683 PE=3 SV=1 [Tsukamurella paurometabola]|uniref:NLP/P60 protein n=1 Tax=Tsukamurella paurometabola (strain ATCC 8368 / DSM 20162 / CCUG 35730 / CIP 100753 / JCM 10117 / KCTC 9821 / NBRC 16120 / NCIMB 702349 / NCTC 13040) TaxID=521096 RepID=D5USL2_TSUPD|nr:NlpC/P60 family protein [Tsukamurella paurometabola]ADG79283.1 NLP/P60 protein [Tsukamurella paurometabola DSM 20162]SUP34908.1 Probable endopeptidase cgR_2070 precursor [Tsukamurella paurometabola]
MPSIPPVLRASSQRGFAVSAALLVLAGAAVGGSAGADPNDADAALKQYEKLSEQASGTNEAAKGAQEDVEKATAAKRAADATVTAAQREVAAVQARRDALQPQVDAIVRANYKGARTNRTFALLVSDSPQKMLDQMSTLDFLNRDVVSTIDGFKKAKAAAVSAEQRATEAAKSADTAKTDAERKRDDLNKKKAQLAAEIARIKALYDRLTGAQRGALVGPNVPVDPTKVPPGSSSEAVAVRAALTRVGMPYAWGGSGPGQFDCSGLMLWAYKQAGKSLPRTSQAQLSGGQPVSRSNLQPGDIIVYYPGATHVGMYIGDGKVVHASTFGVPVQVTSIDGAGPYNSAVRF